MRFDRQSTDTGVSPVVGVILMVAITVILSAIIATFVLDLGGDVSQNPSAGVTFDEDASSGTVDVQLVSLENADQVDISRSDQSGYSATLSSVGADVTVGDATAQSEESFANGAGTDDVALSSGATITVTATLDGKTSVTQTHTYDG